MKNKYPLLFSLLVLGQSLSAQRMVEVSYQQDAKGNYNFSCVNKAFCNYILAVSFTTLDNARCDHALPYFEMVKPGATKLFRVSPENPAKPIQINYKASYAKGCIDPKTDPGFTYLLPISPGKQAQAYEIGNSVTPDASGAADPRSLYAIRLKMKPGDTLFAARRGIVSELDVSSNLNDSGVANSGSGNYIEIVHGDCSFGRYGIFKKNSAFVRLGQQVEAGQPIGLVGGDKFGRGSEARFSVYYNRGKDEMQQGGSGEPRNWAYVHLKFWTKNNGKGMLKHGGEYISEFPAAVLAQELPTPASKKGLPKKGAPKKKTI